MTADPLLALVEPLVPKWRKHYAENSWYGEYNESAVRGYSECADQLESAIKHAASASGEPEIDWQAMHAHLLDILSAKDHADAGRVIGELHAAALSQAGVVGDEQALVDLFNDVYEREWDRAADEADDRKKALMGQADDHATRMAIRALLAAAPINPPEIDSKLIVPVGWVLVPRELAEHVDDALGRFCSGEDCTLRDMEVMDGFGAMLAAAPAAQASPTETPRHMSSAPRDGTMLRLLVDFEDHATEDSPDPSWTIGANNCDYDGEDEWKFAGWCWSHDHFTQGTGKPVGWLPMLSEAAAPAVVVDEAMAALYDAASVGFHVTETCGPEGKYQHVSKFHSMDELHAFRDAWTKAMTKVRDGRPS